MAKGRHVAIQKGLDPFEKADRVLSSKNSPVPRLKKQVWYKIPKKTLQLEVKRVAAELGHIPSRERLTIYSKYSIEYYDEYFVSWGEVTAAARTTGMTERRANGNPKPPEESVQPRLLEKPEEPEKAEQMANERDLPAPASPETIRLHNQPQRYHQT